MPESRKLRGALGAVLALVLAVALANLWVLVKGGKGTDEIDDVPSAQTAIVLGAPVHRDGTVSKVLRDRLDAGLELWRAGKVERLLLSGYHHGSLFDEPDTMRMYLQVQGVPDAVIFTDHEAARLGRHARPGDSDQRTRRPGQLGDLSASPSSSWAFCSAS